MNTIKETINGITFYQINNDYYGNPRYVVHFLALSDDYENAIKLAKKIGGKKYRAKWFGGGIVFETFSPNDIATRINAIKEN
jgi:hypothetical protein